MNPRTSALLLLLAILVPVSAAAQRTEPIDPPTVNQRLEIGPLEGFTTTWHPAPLRTSAPRGATLQLRVRLPRGAAVTWSGAEEVVRDRFSQAETELTSPGRHVVGVRIADRAGNVVEESIDLDVRPLLPGQMIRPIEMSVDELDLRGKPSNEATLEQFFRFDSIAALTEVAPGHFRTSTQHWITLTADVLPVGFAPLLEWRVDGIPLRHLGSSVRVLLHQSRNHQIAAGLGNEAESAQLDTYRVSIDSHLPTDLLPEGEAVTFTAATDPPGFEDEITWLASTKYGTAEPLTHRGSTFTTTYLNTASEEGRWLGVRADNATVRSDGRSRDLHAGEEDDEELPQLSARAEAVCDDELSHRLEIAWQVLKIQGPKEVEIAVTVSDGSELDTTAGAAGSLLVPLDLPFGGTATVELRVPGQGAIPPREARALARLDRCVELAGPPFDFPPGNPILVSPGSGLPREVDVASLGRPSASLSERIVTAVGSGSAFQLSSWESDGGATPAPLRQGETLAGFDVRLHQLTAGDMEVPVQTGLRPFVVATRRNDGNLWLSTYSVEADGEIVRHATLGFGTGAPVTTYGIAHRTFVDGPGELRFQLLTPVVYQSGAVHLAVWEVDGRDLSLRGLRESGLVAFSAADDPAAAQHVEGSLFVVSHRSESGVLSSTLWDVGPEGDLLSVGQATSGLDLRTSANVGDPITEIALAPLVGGGFVSATPSGPADVAELVVWEAHQPFPWLSDFEVRRMADNRLDQDPGPGVGRPLPVLADDAVDPDDGSIRQVHALLSDLLREELGTGAGTAASQIPSNDTLGIASLTKKMTLVLALEAIGRGDAGASFDAEVTISANAGDEPKSKIGLVEGQVCTLEGLLYALMLPSAGDAAVAIAEHLAGSEGAFVDRMNFRAAELGLDSTDYRRPRGSGRSVTQDQITLLRHALALPRFTDFANTQSKEIVCYFEVPPFRFPTIYSLRKGDSGYPGLIAWKGGSRGGRFSDEPRCPKAGCLSAAATRLDRTYGTVLIASGNVARDSNALFDFGFRKLFTPDFRADDAGVAGAAEAFAVDAVFDTTALTAALRPGGDLEVCTWAVDAGDGLLDLNGCGTRAAPPLAPGPPLRTRQVELVRLSTEDAAGDYLRGHLDGGDLVLDLWRIGPRFPQTIPVL